MAEAHQGRIRTNTITLWPFLLVVLVHLPGKISDASNASLTIRYGENCTRKCGLEGTSCVMGMCLCRIGYVYTKSNITPCEPVSIIKPDSIGWVRGYFTIDMGWNTNSSRPDLVGSYLIEWNPANTIGRHSMKGSNLKRRFRLSHLAPHTTYAVHILVKSSPDKASRVATSVIPPREVQTLCPQSRYGKRCEFSCACTWCEMNVPCNSPCEPGYYGPWCNISEDIVATRTDNPEYVLTCRYSLVIQKQLTWILRPPPDKKTDFIFSNNTTFLKADDGWHLKSSISVKFDRVKGNVVACIHPEDGSILQRHAFIRLSEDVLVANPPEVIIGVDKYYSLTCRGVTFRGDYDAPYSDKFFVSRTANGQVTEVVRTDDKKDIHVVAMKQHVSAAISKKEGEPPYLVLNITTRRDSNATEEWNCTTVLSAKDSIGDVNFTSALATVKFVFAQSTTSTPTPAITTGAVTKTTAGVANKTTAAVVNKTTAGAVTMATEDSTVVKLMPALIEEEETDTLVGLDFALFGIAALVVVLLVFFTRNNR